MTSATNHATLSRTTSACSLPINLSTNSTAVILPFSAIVVLLHPSICERPDDSEAHGGRPTSRPGQASSLHHFYRLDPLRAISPGSGDGVHARRSSFATWMPPLPPVRALECPQNPSSGRDDCFSATRGSPSRCSTTPAISP